MYIYIYTYIYVYMYIQVHGITTRNILVALANDQVVASIEV